MPDRLDDSAWRRDCETEMNDLTIIGGRVEGFERSTHTSGHDHVSTTHLSMFKVDAHRVMLRTTVPSVISDGDEVILAGTTLNGQFIALACKNVSANWVSPLKQQGCAFALLICMAVISLLMSFLVLPIVFCGICVFFAYKVKKHDNMLKKAHRLVTYA